MPRPQLDIITDIINSLKVDISNVSVDINRKQNLIYLYNELFSSIVPVSGVTSVNGMTGIVPLTGTSNRINISLSNVFDIGSEVVTLSDSQAISNKTGLISQWNNDVGYITSISGYTPINRTLTINSVTQDLSLDRVWDVGTLTSINTSGLISGGPITNSGTITTSMNTNKLVGRATSGIGIMEEITLGTGLSFSGTTLNATASVTPAALTKVDDTNITLTLGGSPNTALLQSTSLTLGWTGTLADSRIASSSTWNSKQVGSSNLTSLSSLSYVSTSFVKMTGANTFSLDTSTYLTSNQTITLSGDVSGSGTTAITTTIGALKVTTGMLQANAVTLAKMDATDATAGKVLISGSSTSPTWYTPTTGRIIYTTTAGALISDATLLYDGTNGQIGNNAATTVSIGTSNPTTSTVNQLFVGGNGICLAQNVFNGEFEFGLSYYYNSGFKYRFANCKPMRLAMNTDGVFDMTFETVASTGTANASCTFVEQMRFTNTGNLIMKTGQLLIGGATSASLGSNILIQPRKDANAIITGSETINATNGTGAGAATGVSTSATLSTEMSLYAIAAASTRTGVLVADSGILYTNMTGGMVIATDSNSPISFWTNSIKNITLNPTGIFKIAGISTRGTTEGTNHLDIFNGTAPAGTLSNGISLYSNAGVLKSINAAGTDGFVNVSTDGAIAPGTNAIGVILDYYGTSATRVLTTPNAWESVIINGTTYKRPLYI